MEATIPFLNDLPPNKRLRLMQKQQHHSSCSPLPAKKRKESRNPTFLDDPPSPPQPSNTVYSLPAKKRVYALQSHHLAPNDVVSRSFDLNNEPINEAQLSPEKAQQEENINDDNNSDDDGIVCCVCQSTDGDPADPIVLCDGCDVMVHASCYGNPLSKGVPDGDWFCERCRFSEGEEKGDFVCCSLCPVKEGAMKRTTDQRWAHVVCALLVPEVFFLDSEGREGIDCSKIPKKRWLEKCYVCGSCDGCALVCSEPKCGLAFHVTCGLREDLCIEYKEGKKGATIVAGFCKTHTQIWDKQQQSGKYKIVAVDDK
ncbi:uncharacterized protein LOC133300209 [Gastrolobium bilobum]|uniref:uncharacterized protein LOC133300209 n=1 Tax=Gastrolobium bilobum TaxID=150636 RepID=UPI002AB0873D|nr:uncharacterized protein LOC133300209 [Gastrolobium bilobum]